MHGASAWCLVWRRGVRPVVHAAFVRCPSVVRRARTTNPNSYPNYGVRPSELGPHCANRGKMRLALSTGKPPSRLYSAGPTLPTLDSHSPPGNPAGNPHCIRTILSGRGGRMSPECAPGGVVRASPRAKGAGGSETWPAPRTPWTA